jgi:hypothetical protein
VAWGGTKEVGCGWIQYLASYKKVILDKLTFLCVCNDPFSSWCATMDRAGTSSARSCTPLALLALPALQGLQTMTASANGKEGGKWCNVALFVTSEEKI